MALIIARVGPLGRGITWIEGQALQLSRYATN